jgi:predicted HicB family RNase H-like nuclease
METQEILSVFDLKIKELEEQKEKLSEQIKEKEKKLTLRINGLYLARREFEKALTN